MSKFIKIDRYLILSILLILGALGLALLPKYTKNKGIQPDQFLKNIVNNERYMSTDKLAEYLVNQDPSILLIDLRSKKSYQSYSLPNAMNIPFEQLLNSDFEQYLNQDVYDVVLYSNDNFTADQAWMLCNKIGYENLHVLEGGLNEWFATIINPTLPNEGEPQAAFELYNLRIASGMYFGVAAPVLPVAKEPYIRPCPQPYIPPCDPVVIYNSKDKNNTTSGSVEGSGIGIQGINKTKESISVKPGAGTKSMQPKKKVRVKKKKKRKAEGGC